MNKPFIIKIRRIFQYGMKGQTKIENIAYLTVWVILFAVPVLTLYAGSKQDTVESFSWNPVFFVWKEYVPFLLIFVLHNYLLAPLLVYNRQRILYGGLIAAVILAFSIIQCSSEPGEGMDGMHTLHPKEEMKLRKKMPKGLAQKTMRPKGMDPELDPELELESGRRHTDEMNPEGGHTDEMNPEGGHADEMNPHGEKPDEMNPLRGEPDGISPNAQGIDQGGRKQHRPPLLFAQHDVVSIVMLLLMIGMNLGVKFYIKSNEERKHLKEMEKHGLEQQLEYLKYQINPHFLMNTLNNIHALVDIDQDKAKKTIVELSKMLRFMLYEGDKKGVPLSREMEFIRTYVELMKLRYTEQVKISLMLPETAPDKMIPPLMLITFIENAFKHGVSYKRDSFIGIAMETTDTEMTFTCRNSKKEANDSDQHGGVGLKNVKQRLDLIYGDQYSLTIDDNEETYNIELKLPI